MREYIDPTAQLPALPLPCAPGRAFRLELTIVLEQLQCRIRYLWNLHIHRLAVGRRPLTYTNARDPAFVREGQEENSMLLVRSCNYRTAV